VVVNLKTRYIMLDISIDVSVRYMRTHIPHTPRDQVI
jgi:hypothetical protein